MSTCYKARFGEKTEKEKQEQHLKTLSVFYNHVMKQLKVEEELYANYRIKLVSLERKKNNLVNLLQGSERKSIKVGQKSPLKQSKDRIKSISQLQQSATIKRQLTHSNIKVNANISSSLMPSPPTRQSANYLTNINEYKHKDLVQQMSSLMNKLTTLIDHNLSNNASSRQSSKLMSRSTLMMQSVYVKKGQQRQLGLFSVSKDKLLYQQNKQLGQQERQFITKYLQEIGRLSRLPVITYSDAVDQVLQSLLTNLQKEQSLLMQRLYRFKHLQIQKIVKQHLQQKTTQNMRVIYNMNKKQQQRVKTKQSRSTRDIVKFGYTEAMLQVIKQKSYPKRR